jgi:hypothetical protein
MLREQSANQIENKKEEILNLKMKDLSDPREEILARKQAPPNSTCSQFQKKSKMEQCPNNMTEINAYTTNHQ